jgi:hypothetical protein
MRIDARTARLEGNAVPYAAVNGGMAGDFRPLRREKKPVKFAKMPSRSPLVSPLRQAVLGVLLDVTVPLARCGHSLLKPLWVDEAMQRAQDVVRLIVELERKAPLAPNDLHGPAVEYQRALDLAEIFRSLATARDAEMQPCFDALQDAVYNLVDLFGPAIGQVYAHISVERLTLPAYKKRALVLAVCELVLRAMRHGLIRRDSLQINVTLGRTAGAVARLSVADDGWDSTPPPRGIVADLAALLESDVVYSTRQGGGTVAEICFPVATLI